MFIDKKIVNFCVKSLLQQGCVLSVDDHDDDTLAVDSSTEASEIIDAMLAVDEVHLIVQTPNGGPKGWAFFVYGNDGYDVINDYTLNLEEVLKPTNDYAKQFEPN